jgi:hypothetical protein
MKAIERHEPTDTIDQSETWYGQNLGRIMSSFPSNPKRHKAESIRQQPIINHDLHYWQINTPVKPEPQRKWPWPLRFILWTIAIVIMVRLALAAGFIGWIIYAMGHFK